VGSVDAQLLQPAAVLVSDELLYVRDASGDILDIDLEDGELMGHRHGLSVAK
jgi:hypothetical protein